ncbi:MAG TPA: hypothetical protein VIY47_03395 [Ignavibacteriaceae bacterium]
MTSSYHIVVLGEESCRFETLLEDYSIDFIARISDNIRFDRIVNYVIKLSDEHLFLLKLSVNMKTCIKIDELLE